jgi:hypothetical protein
MPSLKNEDERRNESLNIIYQIKQQNLNSKHEAIRHLLELLTIYVQIGLGCETNIPYPELNKTIRGSLNGEKGEKCNIYFTHIIYYIILYYIILYYIILYYIICVK